MTTCIQKPEHADLKWLDWTWNLAHVLSFTKVGLTLVLFILPWPIKAPCRASLAVPKPSSLHTTLAAVLSHMWSTTVPHFPFRSTSTRPSPSLGPALRRTGCTGQQRLCKPVPLQRHTVWHDCINHTTTGWGAWGLPEEIRANWGPGIHLTTACLPFLQGVGLRGMDSWEWHSDRLFSVPRQWTFSTQNPFFFAMRLILQRQEGNFVNLFLKFKTVCQWNVNVSVTWFLKM